jgi:sulfide:quinone oxidoreductase
MAFEMQSMLKQGEKITVVSNSDSFQFVPSNPWVAVNWRTRENICIDLPPIMKDKGIDFTAVGAKRLHPDKNEIELNDGTTLSYDYLIIATGPQLAFDEVEGLGPAAHTHSVCHVDHAVSANEAYQQFLQDPGPIVIGAAAGASCFGPALEMALIIETDLRKRKIRHRVPMTYVTPEPYVGHLGLGGVGDTKGMVESIMRERHINWVCNAKIDRCEPGKIFATEHDMDGNAIKDHELEHKWSMILPAFRGIEAVAGIEGLCNPRDFIIAGKQPTNEGTWSAACLADFGDRGAAFIAVPQIPPRNINWSSEGKWVHYAKIAFEKYFLRKIRKGICEPGYEKQMLRLAGLSRLKP